MILLYICLQKSRFPVEIELYCLSIHVLGMMKYIFLLNRISLPSSQPPLLSQYCDSQDYRIIGTSFSASPHTQIRAYFKVKLLTGFSGRYWHSLCCMRELCGTGADYTQQPTQSLKTSLIQWVPYLTGLSNQEAICSIMKKK